MGLTLPYLAALTPREWTIDPTPDVHHDGDVIFDEFHRGHHFFDALTGQVLEIAGLEDGNDAFLDFLTEQLLLIGRGYGAQRGRRVVDRLGGFQNLLRRFFGAADHGAELAVDLGHFLAVEALAVQHRDFTLGAGDGIVDQVEFDLQFLALLDLRAVGFEQRMGSATSRDTDSPIVLFAALGRGAAIWARIARSSLMISRCRGPTSPSTSGGIAMSPTDCFFDTKTSAMNRHEICPRTPLPTFKADSI